MNRNKHGQFSKKKVLIPFVIFFGFIMGCAIYGQFWVGKELSATSSFMLTPIASADETFEAKFSNTKDGLVESLAKACETKGASEPDAVIILDTNNQMSIGAFQFQIKTVQQYEKSLFGKDVSRVEAIQIAVDHTQSSALAKRILFEVPGGWQNWRNCAQQLDLPVQITLLNSIEK